ncbi:large ribosomal subunit protein P2-like [Halichondria panicea]|uniref:large ribosomal subunit protein P2-like n=1 Tax=Halichondria panicea TaxID=6063 RepID=UPI00312BB67C
MRYVAAYLLASLGQEGAPSKEKIVSILDSVGIDVDNEKLGKLMSELDGKDINEVIADGMGKLASMPSGGAVAVSSGDASGDAPAEEKKEEKKKEESEDESDDDMGFGLFD